MGEKNRKLAYKLKQEAIAFEAEQRKINRFKQRSEAAKRGAETRRLNKLSVSAANSGDGDLACLYGHEAVHPFFMDTYYQTDDI